MQAVKVLRRFSSPDGRCFAVACLGSFAAILIHSAGDFNLYIPANAMLLAWIAGMTEGQSFHERDSNGPRRLGLPQVLTVRAVRLP